MLKKYVYCALVFPMIMMLFCSVLFCEEEDVLSKNNLGFIRAVVDDTIITQDEVIKRSAPAIREARKKYSSNKEFSENFEKILEDTLEELIDRKLLVKEAYKVFGADAVMMNDVQKELDYFLKGAVENVGSLSKFYEIAESQGINPIEKKTELKEDIMIDKVIKENVNNKVKVQPKLLKRYYMENIDEFRQKKEIKLKHIMIKFSSHNDDKEKARALAEKIITLLSGGEDFSSLAKLYSEGPNAEKGGEWSFDEIQGLRKELRDVIYNLKDNEYSKIAESPVGYHIFKTELIKPEMVREFEDVQNEIYQKLYREEIGRLKKKYIQNLRAEAFIKINKY
ncbi:MAG: hypothetical protein FJ264_02200 [Planctomycetes bacterium]|nr:hypothetical protein [Planctomycetota bacterium]